LEIQETTGGEGKGSTAEAQLELAQVTETQLMRKPARPLSGTFGTGRALHSYSEGNHMRQSTATAIGIASLRCLVGGVIGGAYAAFEAVIGTVPAQTASG
jgi:Na+/glutamate symporter